MPVAVAVPELVSGASGEPQEQKCNLFMTLHLIITFLIRVKE